MMQPHDSLPHDDHIHLRISCPHDPRSSCIELARNVSHAKGRVAHKGHLGGAHVLRTPVHLHPTHLGKPPAAAALQAQDPLVLPLPEPAPDAVDVEPDVDGSSTGRTPD
jgi:penicillin-insensitive murein endopeptidase